MNCSIQGMVDVSGDDEGGSSASYWYESADPAVAMLSALRIFQASDQEMRRRMSAGMEMNRTDLVALRHVIAHELDEDPVTPMGLAQHLGISGASTSKLLDRLTASGHLERVPHPSDRRSRVIVATDHAHSQVRERLSAMHERMLEIAYDVPGESRQAVIEFLLAMAHHLDSEATPEGLTPHDHRAE